MNNRAFFYVDGIPTKGIWIEINGWTTEDDVLEALALANLIDRDEIDEPKYGGDLLVADTEGPLPKAFHSNKTNSLDLKNLVEAIDYCEENHVDDDAVVAYIADRGGWSQDDFQEAYCGWYDSELDYAQELFDELYLPQVPEHVSNYIDYEKFARDLFATDYYFSLGYVFRNT